MTTGANDLPFDEETVCLVLMLMAEDGQSLRGACEITGVAVTTFLGWVDGDKELAEHYARARERLLDFHAEQILEIADTPQIGVKTKSNEKGEIVERVEGDMIEHRRLQVEARKWLLSKLAPKKYGDKVAIGGADDLPPIQTTSLTPTQRAARIAAIMAKAAKAKNEAEGG